MAHPRKLIRQAVVALLVAAATAADARVFATRVDPLKKTKLPAISVYTLTDQVDEDASTDSEDTHSLELEIVGFVSHSEAVSVDDAMDDLAEEIETAMTSAPYLDGKASEVRLVGTIMEVREDNGASSPLVGVIALTYAVTYRIDLVGESPTDDFKRVAATHQVNDADDDNTASDQFTVQGTDPWPEET